MGADGHIRIYDKEKVDAKANELDCNKPTFWYETSWTCNGKLAYLAYWGDNMLLDVSEPDDDWDNEQQKKLKLWANENAILVDDQEVWT